MCKHGTKYRVANTNNIQTRIAYTGTKLSSQPRNIKNSTTFIEQHDIVYHSFCSDENYNENYIGESA